MKNKKVFCEKCRDDVFFTIKKEKLEGKIKGENYRYNGKTANCDKCGLQIYVAEINNYNLKSLYDVYRKDHDIISLENILAIPEKYGIGKRPLSLLLGWGEQTFSRYCDGDMPTNNYSDTLKRIFNDPNFYAEILDQNKDNLKTTLSYEKSKKVIDLLLGTKDSNKTKIDSTIEYLLNQCEDITPLALQKALYYIQGFYYAFYNNFIFEDDCQAWVHGPVYTNVYNKYRDYKFNPINGVKAFDNSNFISSEKDIIDSVVKNICCYSGKVLEKFTHSEQPWLTTRRYLPSNIISNNVIDKTIIISYFKSVTKKYNMINANDIRNYTSDLFEKIYH